MIRKRVFRIIPFHLRLSECFRNKAAGEKKILEATPQ